MWNQVLQELQAIEGVEQPTCLEQPPQGLVLGELESRGHYVNGFATINELSFISICNQALQSRLSFADSLLLSILKYEGNPYCITPS